MSTDPQYHILNGDALREQLPSSIQGEVITVRECLLDGSVQGESLDELFENRAAFISQSHDEFTVQDYYEHSVSEFEKINCFFIVQN